MYWDPLPTVRESAQHGAPQEYLRGKWDERDWRNVPGPFYGAQTDTCWMGRQIAPRHIVYEDDTYGEVVFRQPQDPNEVHLVLDAAWNDPFRAYACDGDDRWTLGLIREWWADRGRLSAWIQGLHQTWSVSENDDERDNAVGLLDYASYLDNGLEAYLRDYAFWLDNRRAARPGETLPRLD